MVPFLISRIPADYFAKREAPVHRWKDEHPLLWLVGKALKNVLGLALLLLGIAMLFLPGQGLLTMFVGLVLLDFPGKRRLELSIVRRPEIRRGLNWFRRKAGQGPLAEPYRPGSDSGPG